MSQTTSEQSRDEIAFDEKAGKGAGSSRSWALFAILIIGILLAWPLYSLSMTPATTPSPDLIPSISYVSHAAIYIGGNGDFTGANGVTGGSGTSSDPYIIEGWDIDASAEAGIDIENTDAFFIVTGCNLHGGAALFDGIDLLNCVNGVLDGNNCSTNYDGIYLDSSSDITISNNTCLYSNLNGIDIENSYSLVIVSNNCSYPVDGAGISLYLSNSNIIDGNNCSYSANDDGIDLWESCSDNIITDNICNWNYWDGIWLNYSDNNIIDGNDCYYSNQGAGIELDYSSNNTIVNNNCSYSAFDDGIDLWISCNDNIISHNNCSWNYWDGIWLNFSSRNMISNNDCSYSSVGAVGAGVELDNSSDNFIVGNNCSYSINGDGIDLWISCNNNTIIDNYCSWNSYAGIWLDASINNTIDSNNCSWNSYEGIELDLSSDNNTINHNVCNWNSDSGIDLWSSSNGNTISYNNCSSNANGGVLIEVTSDGNSIFYNTFVNNVNFGMEVKSGSGNLIWNNTFVDNNGAGTNYSPGHAQGKDAGTANRWNSTSGFGNYWTDWQGRDFNLDGIQDAPYNTSGSANAQDFYPLAVIPDTTPPVTVIYPSGTMGANGWYLSNVSVTLQATDNAGGKGVNATYYRIGTSGSWTAYSSPILISAQGITTLQVYSRDNASNDESIVSVLLMIDSVGPTVGSSLAGTLNASGWYNSAVNVSLSPSDPSPGSGVDYSMYKVDGGAWTTYTGTFAISAEGAHTVQYYAVDNAGNVGTTGSTTFKVDAIPPSGTIAIMAGADYTKTVSVNLTLQASDATSGIDQVRYSNDSSTWSSWENYSGSKNWTLLSGDGNKTVYYQVSDNASNVLTINATIVLDTTVPVISFGLANGFDFTTSSAIINWSATDVNGIGHFEYSADGASFVSCGLLTEIELNDLTEGGHNLTVRAVDSCWEHCREDALIRCEHGSAVLCGSPAVP